MDSVEDFMKILGEVLKILKMFGIKSYFKVL